jgi:hypothetical protein
MAAAPAPDVVLAISVFSVFCITQLNYPFTVQGQAVHQVVQLSSENIICCVQALLLWLSLTPCQPWVAGCMS